MIQLNELRIGNIIEIHLEGHPTIQFKVDVQVLRLIESGLGDNYSGVKITEKMLLKCGFVRDVHNDFFFDKKINKDDKISIKLCIYSDKENDYFLCGNINTVFKYIHQLQNIYFTLTGNELSVKKYK